VKNRFERREKAYRKFVKHVHYDQGHVSRPMFSSLFAPTNAAGSKSYPKITEELTSSGPRGPRLSKKERSRNTLHNSAMIPLRIARDINTFEGGSFRLTIQPSQNFGALELD
jgi:hypothetical protein